MADKKRSKKDRETGSRVDALSIVIRDKSGRVMFDGRAFAGKLRQKKGSKR